MAYENIDIFEDEDLEVTVPDVKVMPTTLSKAMFPDAPNLSNPSAIDYFLPFLKDEESYLAKYGTPSMSDEEIEALYKKGDYSKDKRLALAQFGFGLMAPTRGGKIGPSLSMAGQQYAQNLSKVNQLQRADAKESRQGTLMAKLKRDAQKVLDKKGVDDQNNALLLNIASKEYDKDIAADAALTKLYQDQMKAAQSRMMDFEVDKWKPKRVSVRQKLDDGTYTEPFDAFTVNGQYYKPTNEIGADGLPQLRLIENPEGIQELKMTMAGTPGEFKEGSGAATFEDILSSIQVKDRAILTLDELTRSYAENPNRAGFIAGIKKRVQTYAQIFNDAFKYSFNDFFQEGNDRLNIKPGQKLQLLSSTVHMYLQDPNIQEDIASGRIDESQLKDLQLMDRVFEQLSVIGKAELDSGAMKYNKGSDLWESDEQRDLIFKKLRWYDTDLPANEVRANSIIYAIARARKSSGRLNLDDIERAAKDLNIYGDDSVAVLEKIKILRGQLLASRADDLTRVNLIYPTYYKKMMDAGFGHYQRDNILGIVQEQFVDTPQGEAFTFSWGDLD